MRRRIDDPSESSLELLLDTISNAFGGILFLAILMALLLRLSGRSSRDDVPTQELQSQVVALETAHSDALQELGTLQRAYDERLALRVQLQANQLDQSLEQLQQLRSERDQLSAERRKNTEALADLQIRINTALQTNKELSQNVARVSGDLALAEEHFQEELQARSQDAKLPHSRTSQKREVAFVLRYGRLYQLHKYERGGLARTLNTADFVLIADEDDSLRVTPKPFGGLDIAQSEAFATGLRSRLLGHDPQRWHVTLAVWQDSFDVFLQVKNALVGFGYEYRLLPMTLEGKIVEGNVPDPQVQ